MKVSSTKMKGLKVIETEFYEDSRGWFTETYTEKDFLSHGINVDFVQDNHSYSARRGTLRGIHFQINPKAQSKLVRCTRGAVMDTVVDLRVGSDTYLQWFSVELSAENRRQLFVPQGFGHAFLSLTDDAEVQYKVDEYYSREHDRSVRFDDPDLAIPWGMANPIVSRKDEEAPYLSESDVQFSIKVLVTGVSGQLGYDVVRRLQEMGIEAIGASRDDFDLTDEAQTHNYILQCTPDVVVHCAAYTAVDRAEDEQDACYSTNVEGTRYVAKACRAIEAKLIYISSDYVFAGRGTEPYVEDQPPEPINYYGYTKAQGERIVQTIMDKYFIVRTSWLYGLNGPNFVKTMLRLAQTNKEVKVVSDQIGTPTYTRALAVFIADLLQTTGYGIYHGVNDGYCSWAEFATAIFRKMGLNTAVRPIPTLAYPTRAKRPFNSRLAQENLDKHGFRRIPHWQESLDAFLDELKKTGM